LGALLPLKDEVVAIEQSPKNGGLPIDTLKMLSYVSYPVNFYRSE